MRLDLDLSRERGWPGLSESAIERFEADAQIARDGAQARKAAHSAPQEHIADHAPRELGIGGDHPHSRDGAPRPEQLAENDSGPRGKFAAFLLNL